jgi:hypothetical protein
VPGLNVILQTGYADFCCRGFHQFLQENSMNGVSNWARTVQYSLVTSNLRVGVKKIRLVYSIINKKAQRKDSKYLSGKYIKFRSFSIRAYLMRSRNVNLNISTHNILSGTIKLSENLLLHK